MRLLIILFVTLTFFSCKKTAESISPIVTTDSFTVSVTNGYGSGKYKTGDTVHIFSTAYTDNQLFNSWSGNSNLLNEPLEWHTWFIMPNTNVTFTGSIKTITAFSLQLEQIRGRDRLKPVYYHFPAGYKGAVYLLHGSGGSAQQLVNSYESKQLIKDLVADGFAVIVTEAEEATTGIDVNGDGKLRWSTYPADTLNNVDYVNIRNITDSFYNRGLLSRLKPRYAVGMSNGGAYAATLSYAYHFKAGISYCAPGGSVLAQVSTVPLQFCMARFDNNENVGPTGNADALANSITLTNRGICSKYYMKERAPLYPERFARRGDITLSKSQAVFAELKSMNYLDSKNYFIGYATALVTAFQGNPASFPQLSSLTLLQAAYVIEQIDLSVSDHQMYSDYNRVSLRFLNQQCQ